MSTPAIYREITAPAFSRQYSPAFGPRCFRLSRSLGHFWTGRGLQPLPRTVWDCFRLDWESEKIEKESDCQNSYPFGIRFVLREDDGAFTHISAGGRVRFAVYPDGLAVVWVHSRNGEILSVALSANGEVEVVTGPCFEDLGIRHWLAILPCLRALRMTDAALAILQQVPLKDVREKILQARRIRADYIKHYSNPAREIAESTRYLKLLFSRFKYASEHADSIIRKFDTTPMKPVSRPAVLPPPDCVYLRHIRD